MSWRTTEAGDETELIVQPHRGAKLLHNQGIDLGMPQKSVNKTGASRNKIYTLFGSARERRRARMTTASTPDDEEDAARVVRVQTSHRRCRPVWSTYEIVCNFSHFVLATSSRLRTRGENIAPGARALPSHEAERQAPVARAPSPKRSRTC